MEEIYSVKDIPNFDKGTEVYLDPKVKKKIYKKAIPGEKTYGFLVGDVITYENREYVCILNTIEKIEEMEDKIDDSRIVVGSYITQGNVEYHLDELPIGLADRSYYCVVKANSIPNEHDVDLEVFKSNEGDFSKVRFGMVSIPTEERRAEEEINIQEELAIFRHTERLLNFVLLAILSGIFGIFGGLVGFYLSEEQPVKRRVSLLLIGILSTVIWFSIPYLP